LSASSVALHPLDGLLERFRRLVGGRARGRVVLLLACVLGLVTADVSMIGALASKLESALKLSNLELGLLAAVPSLVAALATIPVGVLTDRVNRVRLMAVSVLIWSGAMAASGLAGSFAVLLLTRLGLGAATATAGPPVSSLIGDYFPASERARMYGLILSGELVGAGLGYVVSGEIASAFTWRAAFFVLAVPSLVLAAALWRHLPEPERGGASQLPRGSSSFHTTRERERADEGDGDELDLSIVQRKVEEGNVTPWASAVLGEDPARMDLWTATRQVLRVRTNLVLIIASALGYFYLNGVETFGLEYFRGRYHLSQSAATLLLALLGIGGLVGVLSGGRLADWLVRRGHLDGRIVVGAVSAIAAAALFLPALLSPGLILPMLLFVVAAAAFAARDPALDAARLDVMHHRLWGRAEAVRTMLRRLMVACAPVLFGFVADAVVSTRATDGQQTGFGASASYQGLRLAFVILLVTLLASGLLTLLARRTYPHDVASAVASEQAVSASPEG
jgi:predicted MFS family arabinose efflux permease